MIGMKENYVKKISTTLKKELALSNSLAFPKIEKVVINIGLGRMLANEAKVQDALDKVAEELALLSGQRPLVTKARKSIASFKIREGQPIGLKITLRGQRMYDFLDRTIHIALPRSRDFKGIKLSGVDEDGNLTIGIREHTIFPELSDLTRYLSFEISVVTSTRNRENAIKLFRALGFPLEKIDRPKADLSPRLMGSGLKSRAGKK